MLEEAKVTDDDTQDIPVGMVNRQVNVNPYTYVVWSPERVTKDAFWCYYNNEWYAKSYYRCVTVEGKTYCWQDSPVYQTPDGIVLRDTEENRATYSRTATRKAGNGDDPYIPGRVDYGYGKNAASGYIYHWKSPKDKLKEALESA